MASAPVYIVSREYLVGTLRVERGDRFDKARHGITDVIERSMVYTGQIVPLTAESFALMNAWRPKGTFGRGWTAEFLVENGIITASQVASHEAHKTDAEAYLGYQIVPVKQGAFTRFEVTDKAGLLMREKRFAKIAGAKAFIDTLPPVEAEATAEAAEESQEDDVHVQSESRDAA